MFNSHSHTTHSHDGKNTVEEMIISAIDKNLSGIAITDHADILLYNERNVYNQISKSILETNLAKQKYGDKIKIVAGVELGEAIFDKDKANTILSLPNLDFVLASIHIVPKIGKEADFGYANISTWSKNKIYNFLEEYYSLIYQTCKYTDFDSLAHLNLPERYINGVYQKGYDFSIHDNIVKEILTILVKNKKALEINASNYNIYNIFMASERYLKTFLSLGGKYITLGCDSHSTSNIDNGLTGGLTLLKSLGVKEYHYYENRKPKQIKL